MGTSVQPTPAQQRIRESDEFKRLMARRQKFQEDHLEHLRRQSFRILEAGGSRADVVNFIREEGVRVAAPVVANNDPQFGRAFRAAENVIGLSQRALQGITFGFGDEAIGSILGIATGQGAAGGREQYRRYIDEWSKEHKVAGFTAEVFGNLLTGAGVSKLVKTGASATAGTIARIAKTGAEAAAAGALAAAGNTEGGVSDRVRSAVIGGAFGGVLGGGLVAASRVAGSVARPVARAATQAVPQRWRAALQRLTPGVGTPRQQAEEFVERALLTDKVGREELLRELAKREAQGIPVSLVDLGGQNLVDLGAAASSLRSPQKQAFIEALLSRQAEQGERISGKLLRMVMRGNRLGVQNAYSAADDLTALRATATEPLYKQAFQEVAGVSDRMKQIMNTPLFRRAYDIGRRIAKTEDQLGAGHGLKIPAINWKGGAASDIERTILEQAGRASPEVVQSRLAAVRAATGGGSGAVSLREVTELPIRAIDYMKHGVDELIEKGVNGKHLAQKQTRALKKGLRELLDLVENDNYKKARAVFSDYSGAIDAIEAGREAVRKKLPPDQIAKVFRDVLRKNPGDADYFRLGGFQAVSDIINSPTSETADVAALVGGRIFQKNSLWAQRIRALYPDAPRTAEDVLDHLASEARVSQTTRRVVRGPGTQSLARTDEIVEGAPPSVRINPAMTAINIGRQAAERARGFWLNDVSDQISEMLTYGLDGDYNALRMVIARIGKAGETLSRRRAARLAATSALGQQAGGLIAP